MRSKNCIFRKLFMSWMGSKAKDKKKKDLETIKGSKNSDDEFVEEKTKKEAKVSFLALP